MLSVAATLVLLGLYVRRLISPYRGQKNIERRQQIQDYLLLNISSPVDLMDAKKPLIRPRDFRVVLSVALELVRSVTGRDAHKLAHLVDRWIGRENLMFLLQDGQRGRMIQVLALMSYFDDVESKAPLYDHLDHHDPYVQLAALRSLARRADPSEYPDILDHVRKMSRSNAAFMADVLTRFGPKAVPFLIELLAQQTDENWRAATIAALGNVGDMSTAGHIAQFAGDDSAAVRQATARTLGELQATDAVDALHQLARDKDVGVRESAIIALGKVHTDSTYQVLLDALDDDEWWARYYAAQALLQIGEKGRALLDAYAKAQGEHAELASQILREQEGAQFV